MVSKNFPPSIQKLSCIINTVYIFMLLVLLITHIVILFETDKATGTQNTYINQKIKELI